MGFSKVPFWRHTTVVLAQITIASFIGTSTSFSMGRKPTAPLDPNTPAIASVADFAPSKSGLAFQNYNLWKKSILIEPFQLYHCAGMALFVRQIHNFGQFEPSLPKLGSAIEYERVLKSIFDIHTAVLPGSIKKIVIPGFSNLMELSKEAPLVESIKNILGDAWADILRPNWNWGLFDVFGFTVKQRLLIEGNIRNSVSKGRPAMIYMTDGVKSAHSILLYKYEVLRSNQVRYWAYDSNHPGAEIVIEFDLTTGKVFHPDFGSRDPWILHPYGDEFTSTQSYIKSLR